MESPLWGLFLCPKEVRRCQENQNNPVLTLDVRTCRTADTVNSTESWWRRTTSSTAVLLMCIKSTAEHGNGFVTAMSRHIPSAKGALSKASLFLSKRYTTRFPSHSVAPMTEAIWWVFARAVITKYTMRLVIDSCVRDPVGAVKISVTLGPGKRRPLTRTKTAVQTGY